MPMVFMVGGQRLDASMPQACSLWQSPSIQWVSRTVTNSPEKAFQALFQAQGGTRIFSNHSDSVLGVLARDPGVYCAVLRALLKSSPTALDNSSPPNLPSRLKIIITQDEDLTTRDENHRDIMATPDGIFENFIRKLEASLGVQREYVILESLWEETKLKFSNSQQNSATAEPLEGMGDEFGDVSTSDRTTI